MKVLNLLAISCISLVILACTSKNDDKNPQATFDSSTEIPKINKAPIKAFYISEDELSSSGKCEWCRPDSVKFTLEVKDSSLYSKEYLAKLEACGFWKVKLIDNLFIRYVNERQDSFFFPKEPLLKKPYQLEEIQDSFRLVINLLRINLTSIKYQIQLFSKDKQKKYSESGIATIHPLFNAVLGLESAIGISAVTGEYYNISTFYKDEKNYSTLIRLGTDKQSGNLLLGSLNWIYTWEYKGVKYPGFSLLKESN